MSWKTFTRRHLKHPLCLLNHVLCASVNAGGYLGLGALVGAGDGMGWLDIETGVGRLLKTRRFVGGSTVLSVDELEHFLVEVWIGDLCVSAFFASSTAAVLGWGRLSSMALIRLVAHGSYYPCRRPRQHGYLLDSRGKLCLFQPREKSRCKDRVLLVFPSLLSMPSPCYARHPRFHQSLCTFHLSPDYKKSSCHYRF